MEMDLQDYLDNEEMRLDHIRSVKMKCQICQREKPLCILRMDKPEFIEDYGTDWESHICDNCWLIITQIAYNLVEGMQEKGEVLEVLEEKQDPVKEWLREVADYNAPVGSIGWLAARLRHRLNESAAGAEGYLGRAIPRLLACDAIADMAEFGKPRDLKSHLGKLATDLWDYLMREQCQDEAESGL